MMNLPVSPYVGGMRGLVHPPLDRVSQMAISILFSNSISRTRTRKGYPKTFFAEKTRCRAMVAIRKLLVKNNNRKSRSYADGDDIDPIHR